MTDTAQRSWVLPAMTIVMLVSGAIAVTIAIMLFFGGEETPPPATAPVTEVTVSPEETAPAETRNDAQIATLVDAGWVNATAQTTGIPPRALSAYAGAAIATTKSHPSCNIGWNSVAGIGFVESEHGTLHGSSIGDDGQAIPPIIGVPLNGDGVARISDTDGGELDGDDRWDRAVGPMQFIPSTWRDHGKDGSDDGQNDPQTIDDAALAAAMHLCDIGGDLSVPQNWVYAVMAYNSDVEYATRVANAANEYARTGG